VVILTRPAHDKVSKKFILVGLKFNLSFSSVDTQYR
jgi:hypothetical protein